MSDNNYQVIETPGGKIVKAWVNGVEFEDQAREQIRRIAQMPFVYPHVAIMPDVHLGIGATVGSVIPTLGAVVPASIGVDIGCGMMALKLPLRASDLPESLAGLRSEIERAVPHGRTGNGGKGDRGAWGNPPGRNVQVYLLSLNARLKVMLEKHPKITHPGVLNHLGTLGTGNHFIEVCLDDGRGPCHGCQGFGSWEQDAFEPNSGHYQYTVNCQDCGGSGLTKPGAIEPGVWVVLHSGSRGPGNKIGSYFIELAKEDMRTWFINLPDQDLAYFPQGTDNFDDYVEAVSWAQDYARFNRELMMYQILDVLQAQFPEKVKSSTNPMDLTCGYEGYVSCHHNYVTRENHGGKNVLITRKGAVCAREGMMGIIPGSMGARTYIVRGKGSRDSLHSCSHGAGRRMSRTQARKQFTLEDHAQATAGVECRKDAEVIDETPAAYKDVDAVMAAQSDLVDIVHTLHQVVCVKG